MSGDGGAVGWVGLAVSLIFIAVAMAVTSGFHLKLNRPIVVAVVRSLVQMGIVGYALVLLVDPDTSIWWSWAWTVGIIVFAAVTVTRRAPRVPGLFLISMTACTTIAVTSLAVIFGFGIFELTSRALVPVAGMVVGNSMKVGVVATTRVSEFASDQRAEVEQTAALGIVFLPGAMTGLILAGMDPLEAVATQLALMYVILAGVVIAAVITRIGTLRALTTPGQTLAQLARQG
jgi:putative ABC transport system permease protein